jgi:hypothetical protein
MAKKSKRKVSGVSEAAQISTATAEGAAPDSPVAAYPARSYTRRQSLSQDFNPDYRYVINDLKRIGILAGTFFVLLILLSFIMPLIMP